MDTKTIVLILLAHYIGDWVFQPFLQRWMGQKHRKLSHLAAHTATLAIPLVVLAPVWGIVNALAHGAIDAVTSRLTHRFSDAGRMPLFWLTIGSDQTLHLVLLFWTWGYLA